MKSTFYHLAANYQGQQFAAASKEVTISIWHREKGNLLGEFETIFDGEDRLAFSESHQICALGAYYEQGIAAYEVPTGKLLWQRKDLKKVQHLTLSPDETQLYCIFEKGPAHVLHLSNGKTKSKIPSLKRIFLDHHRDWQLWDSRGGKVVDELGKPLFSLPLEKNSLLSAAFSKDFLALGASGKEGQFFSLPEGKVVEPFSFPSDTHMLDLTSSEDSSIFYGVGWNYEKSGPQQLIQFDLKKRECQILCDLGFRIDTAFLNCGTEVLTTEGNLFQCASGEKLCEFSFPQEG